MTNEVYVYRLGRKIIFNANYNSYFQAKQANSLNLKKFLKKIIQIGFKCFNLKWTNLIKGAQTPVIYGIYPIKK